MAGGGPAHRRGCGPLRPRAGHHARTDRSNGPLPLNEAGATGGCAFEDMPMVEPRLQSTLTCPQCGARSIETMPLDACLYFHDCQACGALLRPKTGDGCVFCSYGDVACPPI